MSVFIEVLIVVVVSLTAFLSIWSAPHKPRPAEIVREAVYLPLTPAKANSGSDWGNTFSRRGFMRILCSLRESNFVEGEASREGLRMAGPAAGLLESVGRR